MHRRTLILYIIDLNPLVTAYTYVTSFLLATKQTNIYVWGMSQTKYQNNIIHESLALVSFQRTTGVIFSILR